MRYLITCTTGILLLLFHLPLKHSGHETYPSFDRLNRFVWVDSLMNSLSLEQKVGQLFMVRAHTDRGDEHVNDLLRQVRNHHIGGLCLFQGTAEKHRNLVNKLQEYSHIPLLVSIDAEWGINMRLKEITPFPKSMSFGSVSEPDLLFDIGRAMAEECRYIGAHMNFAPVLDVNNNPGNPVINDRSFGENPNRVTQLAKNVSLGMMSAGIIPCGKHFPGHGDTDKDSHYDLPIINKSLEELWNIELYPFRSLIHQGLPAVMSAHLHLPKVDSLAHMPASLSKRLINDVLRDSMGFNGLIITDALEMQGVRKHFSDSEIALRTFRAGNDVLLLPNDINIAFNAILNAISKGLISEEELDVKLKRILQFKYDYVLRSQSHDVIDNRSKQKSIDKVAQNSICLLKNDDQIIPLSQQGGNLHHISIGNAVDDTLNMLINTRFDLEAPIDLPSNLNASSAELIIRSTHESDVVIISVMNTGQKPNNQYRIDGGTVHFLKKLNSKRRVLLLYFGNPYGMNSLSFLPNIIYANEVHPAYMDAAAKALFGSIGFKGILPVSVSSGLKAGSGALLDRQRLLEYQPLENPVLDSIDHIVNMGIRTGAFPSANVLVAHQSKIIFHKAYGHNTYRKRKRVKRETVYDLASVTKVAVTGLCLMKLVDEGKLDIERSIGTYIPELISSNKGELKIRSILQHTAGLKPWIPFYKNTVEKNIFGKAKLKKNWYRNAPQGEFNTPVSEHIFMNEEYQDSIWEQIVVSDLCPDNRYRYSDLGFYLMHRLIEKQSGKPMDIYFQENFATPLNLQNTMFNAWKALPIESIPPTENDPYFRNSVVQGYVHDMGAAMLGGVSGHAGLFSNAYDLAILFHMLLDQGHTSHQQILDSQTISLFLKRYDQSRRAVAFDMPELDSNKKSTCHSLASKNTFGHLGFTGTCVWADPERDLVYVFLSNRTFPNMNNIKINQFDIRKRVQGVIYRALFGQERDSLSSAEVSRRL